MSDAFGVSGRYGRAGCGRGKEQGREAKEPWVWAGKSRLGWCLPSECSRKPLRVNEEVLGSDRTRYGPDEEGRQAWGKR